MRGRHSTGRHKGGGEWRSFLIAVLIIAVILGFTWYLVYAK